MRKRLNAISGGLWRPARRLAHRMRLLPGRLLVRGEDAARDPGVRDEYVTGMRARTVIDALRR